MARHKDDNDSDNGSDPILICVNAISVGDRVYQHNRTYRQSELRESGILKSYPECFLSWYSTDSERHRANLIATGRTTLDE